MWGRLRALAKLTPHSERPPLKARFWVYSAAAYLIPVVVQVGFPADPTLSDELIWLVTLVPAFLLSLHYGVMGSLVALVCGTALLISVQLVLAFNYTPDDWRVTVPTYVAYSVLAISIGWLSDQLHDHYERRVRAEREAAIGKLALTVRHELSNSVTALMAETAVLSHLASKLDPEVKELALRVSDTALNISNDLRKFESSAIDVVDERLGEAEIFVSRESPPSE